MKANIDAAEKALTKLKGKAPKMGTSISKYQQEKAAWQEQMDGLEVDLSDMAAYRAEAGRLQGERDAAQAALDYWTAVKGLHDERMMGEADAAHAATANAAETAAVEQARQAEEAIKAEQERMGEEEKAGYSLSNEIDENGRQFVLNSNGDVEFGRIGYETGLSPAPILLSEGLITDPKTNAGYGLMHIEARHGNQIRKAGYDSVVDFVGQVASNYETIKEGKDRNGNKTYLLQLTDKHNNTLVVELSNDGSYWNINTAGIFNNKYASGNNIVYSRHTQTNQQAETGEGSLNAEQSGTQTKTSTMPSTSGRKSTNNSSNNEKNVEEKSEVAESNAVKDANKLASDYKNAAEKAANRKKALDLANKYGLTVNMTKKGAKEFVDSLDEKGIETLFNRVDEAKGVLEKYGISIGDKHPLNADAHVISAGIDKGGKEYIKLVDELGDKRSDSQFFYVDADKWEGFKAEKAAAKKELEGGESEGAAGSGESEKNTDGDNKNENVALKDEKSQTNGETGRNSYEQRTDSDRLRNEPTGEASRGGDGIDIRGLQEGLAAERYGDYERGSRNEQEEIGNQIIETDKKNVEEKSEVAEINAVKNANKLASDHKYR